MDIYEGSFDVENRIVRGMLGGWAAKAVVRAPRRRTRWRSGESTTFGAGREGVVPLAEEGSAPPTSPPKAPLLVPFPYLHPCFLTGPARRTSLPP